ncbi:hypothetical protein, partial [Klebsiella pneumoniae]|uniref:hypothetical protein n=1 Tax=Klebsiella pneumoniae TaxID=573 RepID=UPI003013C25C
SKAEQTAKIKGRKSSSILSSTEPSDASHVDEDKEAEISCPKTSEKEADKSPDPRKSDSKDTHALSGEDQNVDTGASSESEKELT